MLVVFEKTTTAQSGPVLTGGGTGNRPSLDLQELLQLPLPFAAHGQQGPPNNMLQNPHQEDNYPAIIFYSRFTTFYSQAKEADVLA